MFFEIFVLFFSKKKFLIKRELENKNISNKKELPFLLWVLLQLWMYEHGPFKSDLERFLESIYRYSNCSLTASSYLFPEYLAAACHFNLILCSARLRINARWDSRRWSQPRWLSRRQTRRRMTKIHPLHTKHQLIMNKSGPNINSPLSVLVFLLFWFLNRSALCHPIRPYSARNSP